MFCLLSSLTMETWREDGRDRRADRLEKRIETIEEARRKEKQRRFDLTFYALMVVMGTFAVATVAVAIAERSS